MDKRRERKIGVKNDFKVVSLSNWMFSGCSYRDGRGVGLGKGGGGIRIGGMLFGIWCFC